MVCLILEGGIVGKVEGSGVCWGRDLGALRHTETAREAWLNALWRCVLDFGICRSWPLGPPEFIARAAALGKKFGMRVGLCCAGLPEFGCLCKELY